MPTIEISLKLVEQATQNNQHTEAIIHIAEYLNDYDARKALQAVVTLHRRLGHMPSGLSDIRTGILNDLMWQLKDWQAKEFNAVL